MRSALDSYPTAAASPPAPPVMAAPREEARGPFSQGVRAVLDGWAALQIAVENGFGGTHGKEKAEWMVGVVEQYFHSNAALEPEEVEDFLAEVLNNEFDTIVEDGSLAEVSQQLQTLFAQCQRGEGAAVMEAIGRLARRHQEAGRVAAQAQLGEGSSSEEAMEEKEEAMDCSSPAPPPEPPPAEDGWTIVRKKKK